MTQEEQQLRDNLLEYYENYFKVEDIFRVIDKDSFPNREFGFNRLGQGFTRNKSFEKPAYLKEYLATFPVAGAYIGSLYGERLLPGDRYQEATNIHNTEWIGRELIFDLDLDEYDPVRTCDCKGKTYCDKCWGLMQEAAEIIDETLKDDFGFRKRVWLYSGGRGYHCWVLDDKTFSLDQDQRSAIIGYMQLVHDPKGTQKIDSLSDYADTLKSRILAKLGRNFVLNSSTKLLEKEAGLTKTRIDQGRLQLQNSKLLRDVVQVYDSKKEDQFLETLIKHHYPRIDHKVTIDVRRLIRMPGSVHISKLNICHYIDDPLSFDPNTDAINMLDIIGKT